MIYTSVAVIFLAIATILNTYSIYNISKRLNRK